MIAAGALRAIPYATQNPQKQCTLFKHATPATCSRITSSYKKATGETGCSERVPGICFGANKSDSRFYAGARRHRQSSCSDSPVTVLHQEHSLARLACLAGGGLQSLLKGWRLIYQQIGTLTSLLIGKYCRRSSDSLCIPRKTYLRPMPTVYS